MDEDDLPASKTNDVQTYADLGPPERLRSDWRPKRLSVRRIGFGRAQMYADLGPPERPCVCPPCLLSSPGGNDSYDTISITRPRADSFLQLRHVNLKFIFDIPLLAEVIAHYALIVS